MEIFFEPEKPKSANIVDISRFVNSYSFNIAGFVFPTKVSIEFFFVFLLTFVWGMLIDFKNHKLWSLVGNQTSDR